MPDSISWSKISVTFPRRRGDRTCSLCLTEKVFIATADKETSLNLRSEITKRCRHRDNLVLTNHLSSHQRRRNKDGGGEDQREVDVIGREEEDDQEDANVEEEVGVLDDLDCILVGERLLRLQRTTDYRQFF